MLLTTLSFLLLTARSTATNMTVPRKIDVHSHFLPPHYRELLASNGHSRPDGMPAIPQWSADAHLEMMKAVNISKSIISVSSPGTSLVAGNETLTRNLTREVNAYAAQLKRENPEKFGFWASLPLPDVDAALCELETARNEGADGFGLHTNYHGEYVGSASFDRVFDRLNAVHATVFIHPTTPCIKEGNGTNAQYIEAKPFGDQFPAPMFEFFFDTARAVVNLFSSGTVDRCPNITFIIPHAGGAFPTVMTRVVQFSVAVPGQKALNATLVRRQLEKQFYFDTAGFVFDGESGSRGQLKALVEGFDISYKNLLYGSDFPFTGTKFVDALAKRMENGLGHLFSEEETKEIYEGNALRLLAKK